MSEDELDLVETEALVDALHRRQGENGAVLVALLQKENGDENTGLYWRNGSLQALGLAVWAADFLTRYKSQKLDPQGN